MTTITDDQVQVLPWDTETFRRGLIDITGIGVVELDVLAGLGITDFAGLAAADPKRLAHALGIRPSAARQIIADALGFMG